MLFFWLTLLLNLFPRVFCVIWVMMGNTLFINVNQQLYEIFIFYLFVIVALMEYYLLFTSITQYPKRFVYQLESLCKGCLISLISGFFIDIFFVVIKSSELSHSVLSLNYFSNKAAAIFYPGLIGIIILSTATSLFWRWKFKLKVSSKKIRKISVMTAIIIPLVFCIILPLSNMTLFIVASRPLYYTELPFSLLFTLNSLYCILIALFCLIVYSVRTHLNLSIKWLKQWVRLNSIAVNITFALQLIFVILPCNVSADRLGETFFYTISSVETLLTKNLLSYIPLVILILFMKGFQKLLEHSEDSASILLDRTSGNFGTAQWAEVEDLEQLQAYDEKVGPIIGKDKYGRSLFLPLLNKLTISPPGGGKTTASSIPVLLSYSGPVFVFDIKGELWATTARYRSETLGREIVVIDPYGVTKTKDFAHDKPEHLLKDYHINPFDWIPEDKEARDRMLNTFAASLVVNEGGSINHFDENAKILIRGYIDYLMHQDKSQRFLPNLYQLMSESMEEAQCTFDQMSQLDGRAGAAANQINRVGSDERGSILSTSYRQIDWMGDSNIQKTLSKSNFDLADFLKGNMDIFIVLPEDQVKEHSRLFRMIMCLLMSLIIQTDPSNLPKKKMLFLLEEVAQLGASPDIELCIEVLRARNVIVWTVFQALKQIELFAKPDLFKTAAIKQIFTNDDPATMQWVQSIAGDKTILTKTRSTNKGDSRQKMQTFSGTVSSGDGESVHETGVKLVQLNEISVMPDDEQFIFLKGRKPIRCKKVRYFEHKNFKGRFDANPLERH